MQTGARSKVFEILEVATSFAGAALIVRTPAAIAEITGPLPVRAGAEWWTIGEDSGSHLHLRASDVARVRFSAPPDANASLELLASDGSVLCKLSFRGTNARRAERFDAAVAAEVAARFAHLVDPER